MEFGEHWSLNLKQLEYKQGFKFKFHFKLNIHLQLRVAMLTLVQRRNPQKDLVKYDMHVIFKFVGGDFYIHYLFNMYMSEGSRKVLQYENQAKAAIKSMLSFFNINAPKRNAIAPTLLKSLDARQVELLQLLLRTAHRRTAQFCVAEKSLPLRWDLGYFVYMCLFPKPNVKRLSYGVREKSLFNFEDALAFHWQLKASYKNS